MNNLIKIILIILVLNFLFKNNKENFSDNCGANQKLYYDEENDEDFCDCKEEYALNKNDDCVLCHESDEKKNIHGYCCNINESLDENNNCVSCLESKGKIEINGICCNSDEMLDENNSCVPESNPTSTQKDKKEQVETHKKSSEQHSDGDTRLRGDDPLEFSVPEVFKDGSWHQICGHWFWDNDHGATTICNELGYGNGKVRGRKKPLSEDAVYVGRCYKGERMNMCRKIWSEATGASLCKKGNKARVEVKCDGLQKQH